MNNYRAIKWITWKKMDRFLEKFNLPRLNQEEIEIMNNPITRTEIEAVIKNPPYPHKKQNKQTKNNSTRWLHRRILANIQRRANAYPSKTLSKTCRGKNISKFILRGLLLLPLSHFSRVRLCVTPQTAAHQAPPSLGFSGQEHWNGLPFPSPMHEREK